MKPFKFQDSRLQDLKISDIDTYPTARTGPPRAACTKYPRPPTGPPLAACTKYPTLPTNP